MNILNNDTNSLFKFEQDGNNLFYTRYGHFNKISAMTDVHSPIKIKIGEIKSIIGDLKNNQIEYVVFQFNDSLGFGEKNYFLPWHKVSVQATNTIVLASDDLRILKHSPSFHKNHWPDNAAQYMEEVKEYWQHN
jgi:hypothetical protein